MLGEVKKLRAGLAMMRANPNLPHFVKTPMTGETIDVLDGGTDQFVDQLEAFALMELGGKPPVGRA